MPCKSQLHDTEKKKKKLLLEILFSIMIVSQKLYGLSWQ